MLPSRAYVTQPPLLPSEPGAKVETTNSSPVLIVAVAPTDVDRFPSAPYTRFAARATPDAISLIERWRPRLVALDWDLADFDGAKVCAAAKRHASTGILAMMSPPERAPAALKIGCHAVLLKPVTRNLIAARLGRLSRELPSTSEASRMAERLGQFGTNRSWPEIACPSCTTHGAVSFEHSSRRRSWYACLSCESVWLGRCAE